MAFVHPLLLFCAAILFIAALLLATVSDLKTRTIPNIVSLMLLGAGAFHLFSGEFTVHRLLSALIGAALGGFPLLVMALFKGSIGGGDVKLASCSGFFLGWLASYLTLMAALFAFVIFCIFIRPKKESKETPGLPFAPFYAAAAFGAFVLPILPHLALIPIPILYL